jgi:hypothetical protein
MELDDYTQETLEVLKKPGKDIKEAAAGSAVARVKAWRDAFDPLLHMGG